MFQDKTPFTKLSKFEEYIGGKIAMKHVMYPCNHLTLILLVMYPCNHLTLILL